MKSKVKVEFKNDWVKGEENLPAFNDSIKEDFDIAIM